MGVGSNKEEPLSSNLLFAVSFEGLDSTYRRIPVKVELPPVGYAHSSHVTKSRFIGMMSLSPEQRDGVTERSAVTN